MKLIYLKKIFKRLIYQTKFAYRKFKKLFLSLFHKSKVKKKLPILNVGFTLLEIMVVITIMGILATLVIPKIMDRPDDARVVAAKHDVGTLVMALKLYRLDVGQYPSSEQGLKALIEQPMTGNRVNNWKLGGYLDSIPKDPWGNQYQYLIPGVHGEIDVYSHGADGKPGGEGRDADIGNW